jgi:hypothetical protein
MKSIYKLVIVITLINIALYIPLFTLDYQKIINLTTEDHIYENLQAIFFLLSAGIMLYLYIKLTTSGNIFFLLLFLFFIICFGEEVSWGQRIFNIRTPEILEKFNLQKETNIHNLWIFQGYSKNTNKNPGFLAWIMSSSRIFALFWILYCVIIPILNYLSSGIRRIIYKIKMPIIPVWISLLFVLNHFISKIAENMWLISAKQPVWEVKETCFALLYLITSISLYYVYNKRIACINNNSQLNCKHNHD